MLKLSSSFLTCPQTPTTAKAQPTTTTKAPSAATKAPEQKSTTPTPQKPTPAAPTKKPAPIHEDFKDVTPPPTKEPMKVIKKDGPGSI